MCNGVGTLKIPSIDSFRHRNFKKNILSRGQKKDYLRMASLTILIRKTQQNNGSWFNKGIACWITEVEVHIRLPGQLTANYFADHLKGRKA